SDFKDHRDISFILARVEIDYRSPALLTDDLAVYIRTKELGGAKFASEYLILEEKTQRVVATAETVQVCYDYQRKTVTRLSPDLRAKIETLEGRRF
ncbi:MAG: thioesterase family protein, partial [Elusimicrobia bacterium]|nr:thioesterase family protein [Elusimicrobiota bacterium]